MKFRPLHDRVVIQRIEAEAKSAGGKKSELAAAPAKTAEPPSGGDDKPDGGGEVVRLDRFRKK